MFDIHNSLLRVTFVLIAYFGCSSALAQRSVDAEANPDKELTLESIYLRHMDGHGSHISVSDEFKAFPQKDVVEFVEARLQQISLEDDRARLLCYYALFANRAAELPIGRKLLLQALDDPIFGGIAARGLHYTPAEAIDEVRPALLAAAQRPGVEPYQAREMLDGVRALSMGDAEPDPETVRILTSLFTDAGGPSRVRGAAARALFSMIEVAPAIAMIKAADGAGKAFGLNALVSTSGSIFYGNPPVEYQLEVRRQIIPLLIESLQWDAPVDHQRVITSLWMYMGHYNKTDDPEQLGYNRAVYEALEGLDLEKFDDEFRGSFPAMLDLLKPHLNLTGTTEGFVSRTPDETSNEAETSPVSSQEANPLSSEMPSVRAASGDEAAEPTTASEAAPSEEPEGSGSSGRMLAISIGAIAFLLAFAGYRVFSKKGRSGS